MKKIKIVPLFGAMVIVAGLLFALMPANKALAAQITARSLTLMADDDSPFAGGSLAGGEVRHNFAFTVPNAGNANIGTIRFRYCTLAYEPADACTMPTGLVTTTATLDNETGATGFTVDAAVNGDILLERTAASVNANTALTYTLDEITNPTTANQTFYVRIYTYVTPDGSGASTDTGTVTASTATQITLTGIMPESLVFCTGGTVGVNGTSGLPDCTTATSGAVAFNQLFSPTDTAFTTSQMAASTNAGSGYAITVNGSTLTSGSNTITAMGAQAVIAEGVGQFGLNVVDNAAPNVGAAVAPASNGTNYRGQAIGDYDDADNFKFVTGEAVANSNSVGTDAQIFTVSYIVNVPGSQPAGTYTTTLTYICTATY